MCHGLVTLLLASMPFRRTSAVKISCGNGVGVPDLLASDSSSMQIVPHLDINVTRQKPKSLTMNRHPRVTLTIRVLILIILLLALFYGVLLFLFLYYSYSDRTDSFL